MPKKLVRILTPQSKFHRGFNDLYPLYKWQNLLRRRGIEIVYHHDHRMMDGKSSDVLIIDYRYAQRIEKKKAGHNEICLGKTPQFVFDVIEKARKVGTSRIVFFDTRDECGSESLDILPFVDLFLKKQLFKDRARYLEKADYNFMIWLPPGFADTRDAVFKPAHPDHLHKLQIAWNVGMCDYRTNRNLFGIPPSWVPLGNILYSLPLNTQSFAEREYMISYRGSINKHPSYDYQRSLAVETLQSLDRSDVVVGGKVSKIQYLKEVASSKAVLSPFGWGEICYRDFESVLNGSVLVKPDMDHLETYPDFYIDNETYLSLSWDFDNLQDIIQKVDQQTNYENLTSAALQRFLYYQKSFEQFYNHFTKLIFG